MDRPIVTVRAHNPYELRYPGLRVISREELHLIKMLRSAGFDCHVSGPSDRPTYYVTRKGFRDFISDPVNCFIATTALAPVLGVIGNWLTSLAGGRGRRRKPPAGGSNVIIEVTEGGRHLHYTHTGEPISDQRLSMLLSYMTSQQDAYGLNSVATQSPWPTRPYPIFLEHQPKIVGWTDLSVTDNGIACINGKITDLAVLRRIAAGDLRGLSIGIIVTDASCSICGSQYRDCNHISARTYKSTTCVVTIEQALIGDVSVVAEPVNPQCVLELTVGSRAGQH